MYYYLLWLIPIIGIYVGGREMYFAWTHKPTEEELYNRRMEAHWKSHGE